MVQKSSSSPRRPDRLVRDTVPIVASALTPTAPAGAFASRPAASASTASASTAADAAHTATEPVAIAGPAPANDQPINLPTPKRRGEPSFLGQPLLLTGEAKADYDALLAAVSAKIQAKSLGEDIFEEMWARDIVYHEWNMLRLRRFTASLIAASKQEALETVLGPLLRLGDHTEVQTLVLKYTQGDKAAIQQVKDVLDTAGLTFDAVLAEGMASKIETIERFDRMAIAAQGCRDAALRELNRRRFALAEELRRYFKRTEDGRFYLNEPSDRDLEEPSIVGKEPV